MTVNLSKHRTEILNAYNDVINTSSPANWALFGYEGTSNTLFLEESGSEGLEELIQSFNSGKVQYGLVLVDDRDTSMNRLILINWQGEGAPIGRLGVCASHVAELKRQFKGIHMVINARCEDEVEPNEVLKQVQKCTTAGPRLASTLGDDVHEPVGSVYRRTNPAKEINLRDRDSFWEETQKEEASRRKEEEKRISMQAERVQTEKSELQEQISRNFQELNVHKAQQRQEPAVFRPEEITVDAEQRTKSAALREERLQDVKPVTGVGAIGKLNTSRWEQSNGNAGHVPAARPTNKPVTKRWPPVETSPPNKPVGEVVRPEQNGDKHVSPTSPSHAARTPALPVARPPSPPKPPTLPSPSPPKPGLTPLIMPQSPLVETVRQVVPPRQSDSEDDNEQDWDAAPLEDAPDVAAMDARNMAEQVARTPTSPDPPGGLSPRAIDQAPTDYGVCAQALWDYDAADETEISFQPGEIIRRINQIDEGWWEGLAPDGTYGMFPANYVQIM